MCQDEPLPGTIQVRYISHHQGEAVDTDDGCGTPGLFAQNCGSLRSVHLWLIRYDRDGGVERCISTGECPCQHLSVRASVRPQQLVLAERVGELRFGEIWTVHELNGTKGRDFLVGFSLLAAEERIAEREPMVFVFHPSSTPHAWRKSTRCGL